MNDKLLYSTRELFDNYVKGKVFCVPAYQRGYKWEPKDIKRLLDDISEFENSDDLSLFYCLQNITLIETAEGFNVVDGQQRLTTLILILSYLGDLDLIKDKFIYQVREQTSAFFADYILKPGQIERGKSWQDFQTENKDIDIDYQDIYYLYTAYQTIVNWFDNHSSQTELMRDKILNNVKMIVNLPKNIDEQELFENLNGKRVPLDGADLIRALIITRIAKKEVADIEDTVKQNVMMNERRVRIGLTLDEINCWWADDNKRNYFRYFTKSVSVVAGSNVEFREEYHINCLYKLYVAVYGQGKLSMDFYEKSSVKDGFLESLLTLQRTIENWYNDQMLYHFILFTAIYASEGNDSVPEKLTFRTLYESWNGMSRKKFVGYLKRRIAGTVIFKDLLVQKDLRIEEHEEKGFKENWYNNNIVPVSVLLDIIWYINTQNNGFLPAKYFKACDEDIEHIFPQTPIGDRIKDANKQTQIVNQYIGIVNKYAEVTIPEVKSDEADWFNSEWREGMKKKINDALEPIIPLNSIGNVCLLHQSVNRGYGNDFFLEKRIDIMQKSQTGYFIRPHVYDAFNKGFLNREEGLIDMDMMNKWDNEDIVNRRKYIIEKISNLLKNED